MKRMQRTDIIRKVLHLIIGTLLLIAVYAVQRTYGMPVVLYWGVGILIALLVIDAWRLEQQRRTPYHQLLKMSETSTYHAFIFSVAAAIIVLGVFDFPIAFAALFMAVFGDALAAIVGMRWGKHRVPFNKVKTVEGTATNAVVCIFIGVVALHRFGASGILVGVLMGIIATLVEFFSDTTEDNFTVPLFTAFLGQIMWWLF